jgi:type I restriction enzyme, S subunit
MEVKPGYKQTDVGVIPDNWAVEPIGNCASISVGRDLQEKHYSPFPNDHFKYPVFSNTVSNNGLYGFYDFPEYTGDSLTVVGRGVGLGTAFKRSGGYGAIGRLLVLVPGKRYDAGFLTEYINHRVTIFFESGGIPQLTGTSIAKYRLPFPPTKVEQEAIAVALSDADALTDTLEKFLAKKRHLKQGAMHDLLTGKKRLPGFSANWAEKPLAEVAPLQRGFDLPSGKLRQGNYPVVYSNGVLNYHASFQAKGPGVVTGRSGTIGTVTFIEQDFWPHNTSLWVTSFKGNHPKFVYYLYAWIALERFATGSGVPTLNRNDVHAFKVRIPSTKDEQTAIADILSDMDAEIAELEEKIAKTRSLKQGMMQELLTGRIRLV